MLGHGLSDALDPCLGFRPRAEPTVKATASIGHRWALARRSAPGPCAAARCLRKISRAIVVLEPASSCCWQCFLNFGQSFSFPGVTRSYDGLTSGMDMHMLYGHFLLPNSALQLRHRCQLLHVKTMGSHVFRHSVASEMLRQGTPLYGIATVLRHCSIETTTIYAKVNLDLLRGVAQPWPEVLR